MLLHKVPFLNNQIFQNHIEGYVIAHFSVKQQSETFLPLSWPEAIKTSACMPSAMFGWN